MEKKSAALRSDSRMMNVEEEEEGVVEDVIGLKVDVITFTEEAAAIDLALHVVAAVEDTKNSDAHVMTIVIEVKGVNVAMTVVVMIAVAAVVATVEIVVEDVTQANVVETVAVTVVEIVANTKIEPGNHLGSFTSNCSYFD